MARRSKGTKSAKRSRALLGNDNAAGPRGPRGLSPAFKLDTSGFPTFRSSSVTVAGKTTPIRSGPVVVKSQPTTAAAMQLRPSSTVNAVFQGMKGNSYTYAKDNAHVGKQQHHGAAAAGGAIRQLPTGAMMGAAGLLLVASGGEVAGAVGQALVGGGVGAIGGGALRGYVDSKAGAAVGKWK